MLIKRKTCMVIIIFAIRKFLHMKVNLRVTFFPFQKYSLLLIMSLFFLRINIVTNSKITRIAPAFQII